MPHAIDNECYDTFGDIWWAEHGPLALLQQINPTRAAYFQAVCVRALGSEGAGSTDCLAGRRVLDVGCGGGYLAESFARAGYIVSGVDRSADTIETARRHAEATKLTIDYRVADARSLPFADATFDAVVSSDFLEHVSDHLDTVIAEQTRVLCAGGVLGFETVNRTMASWFTLILLAQDVLRLVPRHLHSYALFVRPHELTACLDRYGVTVEEIHGVVPVRHPLAFIAGYVARRESGGFRLGNMRAISYIGFGTKR